MLIFKTKKDLNAHISHLKNAGKRIGLVPTMGALHQGHISLLDFIKKSCDVRVCSIFVNPTQFDNAEDLEKYPRPIEQDIQVLQDAHCEILFLPEVEEMYGQDENWTIDLGKFDSILEGAFRPGHYQGVTQIVHKLFTLVQPHVACFGQKDYQQYLVIEKMVLMFNLPVELVLCPIIREPDGLALSSRNVRLTNEGRNHALAIYNALSYFSENISCQEFEVVKEKAVDRLNSAQQITLEYFELCNPRDLSPVTACSSGQAVIALVAAWVDGVRLIDNVIVNVGK